ncbi:MAG TPA: hypothetical protein VK699_18280 [Terriglobales bacterium]|jgi:hypothetical protein|nr:hypothetical protein [Terriglobales bacterium]
MMNRAMAAAMVLMFYLAAAGAQPPTAVLGVLEEVVGEYADQPNSRGVRVVFHKDGSEWEAFPSDCPDQDCLQRIASEYPPEVNWTIAFDGKNLGQITSGSSKSFDSYSRIGLQQITSQGPVPTIGKRSTEYGGFTGGSVYRPLVANSQPYFKDPEGWKPAQIPAAMVAVLHRQFRQKYPKVINCMAANTEKLWPYRDDDIKIVKHYSSRNNWSLVEMRLNGCLVGDERGDPLDQQWFVIDPEKKITFLGDDMWLVDAGDYDNDGQSELIFAINGYNRGGYELFYDEFRKHAVFEYSYH